MARLFLQDGYTLEGKTLESFGDDTGLPVVEFAYRPAMPEAIYEYRWEAGRAASGKGQLDAIVKLLADHLVKWDVAFPNGVNVAEAIAPIDAATLKRIPDPILRQLGNAVLSWAPEKKVEAAKN